MEQEKYIEEKMKEFAQNIDEYFVGQTIIDTDGSKCKITDKTINSIEVFTEKKKQEGVDSKQWFDMRNFNKRFKIK